MTKQQTEALAWDQRYRRLEMGEVILTGDQVRRDDGSWRSAVCVGETAPDPNYTSHRVYRRLATPSPAPSDTLESGAEPEAEAWTWLESKWLNIEAGHDPNDRDYSADEMVDAFIAGRERRLAPAPMTDTLEQREAMPDAPWFLIAIGGKVGDRFRNTVILDCSPDMKELGPEFHWEDSFETDPPEHLPAGAYVWSGFQLGGWAEDDPIVAKGGTFTPHAALSLPAREVSGERAREVLASWRPAEMTPETAPEWLRELSPEEYARRRNEENASALFSLKVSGDWLRVAAGMLHTAGTMNPSEFGSYGHSCIIVADALIGTREAILAALATTPAPREKLEADFDVAIKALRDIRDAGHYDLMAEIARATLAKLDRSA